MPRVSLIIPCYNQGSFVDEAVCSVQEQTFQDFEIIIVNDGSTDNRTNQLLQDYNRPKTRIVTTENQGLAAARNNGVRKARGEYILPLDADDRIGPAYLEQAVRLLDAQPELGIVYCQAQLFGAVETRWQLPEFSLEAMLFDNVIFCSALFRRKDWQHIGGYDENLTYGWEDYDFWLSLLEMGRNVYQIPEILFYYRVSADSMVRARPRQHKLETFAQIFRKHQKLYADHIEVWIDKLLDVGEPYHESTLRMPGNQADDASWIRKVDNSTRRLEFQIPADVANAPLEFCPSGQPVIVRVISITLVRDDDSRQNLDYTHNADFESDGFCFFCSSKPSLTLVLPASDHPPFRQSQLIFELKYLAFGSGCIPLLCSLLKERQQEETKGGRATDEPPYMPGPAGWFAVNKAVLKRQLKLWRHYLCSAHYRTLKQSGLFAGDYYLQQDQNIFRQRMDPLVHYVETGWREGRNPHPLFDGNWYRQTYQVPEDQDPLSYYLEKGQQAGDNPHPLFWSNWYARTYRQSTAKGKTPLTHYMQSGWREGCNPNPFLDLAQYCRRHSGPMELNQEPLSHFIAFGLQEKDETVRFFDEDYYLEANPSVAEKSIPALFHYIFYGAEAGCSPNRFFEPRFYQKNFCPEIPSLLQVFFHFSQEGSAELHRPSPRFDPVFYSEVYPDSGLSFSHPLLHYQDQGVFSGNYPCREVAELQRKPLISILTPVYNTDEHLLRRCIHSVLYQAYPHWELCLVDDGSSAPHVKLLLEEYTARDQRIKVKFLDKNLGIAGATNAAASLAGGEYLGFLDHDDELTVDALYEMVRAINVQDPDILYSDEDLINNESRHLDSFFKPDFNSELLLCHNYITHFLVTRRSLYEEVGGLSSDHDGAQDFDLLLKLTEKSSRTHHIPKVLYHWRATETSTSVNHSQKDYANAAGLEALRAAVQRRGVQADVRQGVMNYYYELHRHPTGHSLVDIVVLLESGAQEAGTWLSALLTGTRYENIAVYLIPRAPLSSDTEEQLKGIDSRITVSAESSEGNVARAMNTAVQSGRGEFLCFIDQGIRPEENDWLDSFLGYAQEVDTGMIGGLVARGDGDPAEDFLADVGDDSSHAYHRFLTQASVHANGLFCPQEVLALSSTFCMVRRELFVRAGGLDDTGFLELLYDVDLCFQLREQGLRHIFTPYCRAVREGESLAQKSQAGGSAEKVLFQEKWRDTLLRGNPFVNPQLILQQASMSDRDWRLWFAGISGSEETQ